MAIKLKVQSTEVKLKIAGSDAATLKASEGIPIYPDPYEGSYTVTPASVEQTISTNGLMMTNDVTVEAVPLEEKTVSPSTEEQTVTPDEGYYGLSDVVVSPMTNATPKTIQESTRPNTPTVDANGLVTATTTTITGTMKPVLSAGYVDTDFSVPYTNTGGSSTLQLDTQAAKTVTPTESEQTGVASGKYTTGVVKVGAISSTYVGSDIPVNPTPTASGKTVTIPTGYYSAQTTKDVATGTEGTPTATKGTVSNHSVSVTPSVTNTAGYISGSTKTGTAVTVSASELESGTKEITANGTNINVTGYAAVDVSVPAPAPTLETVTKSYTPTTSQQTETITPSTGYDGIGEVDVTVAAMPSGTAGTPTATKGTVSNHAITVTPSVTNTTGYITGGTKTGTGVSVSASELVSGTLNIISSGTKDVTNYANASVSAGTEGTPTATKGTVSNHSISVTPSVTNTAGYISGSTKTGTAVTVSASELVSGSETKTANGTYDVTNLAELVVNVSGGGSSNWTLIASGTLTVNTTSTTAASAGTVSCGSSAWTATDIIWVRIRGQKGKTAGYFYGSDAIFANYRAKNGSTSADSVPAVQYYRVGTDGLYVAATGSYGVYAYSLASDGTLTVRRRYNSTNTLTINDKFDVEVYKLTLPTGKSLFT